MFTTRDAKHVVQLTVLVLMFLDIAIYTGLYESDVSSVRFEPRIKAFHLFLLFLTPASKMKNSHQMVAPLEASSVGEHPRGSPNQKGIQEYQKVTYLFSCCQRLWSRRQEFIFQEGNRASENENPI